jgi:hypothetical protein
MTISITNLSIEDDHHDNFELNDTLLNDNQHNNPQHQHMA